MEFFTKFIKHKGENTFYTYLQEKGFIYSLNANIDIRNTDFSVFSIHFSLTEEGYKNYEEIIKVLFWFLKKIEREGINIEQFNEFKQICLMSYFYKVKIIII